MAFIPAHAELGLHPKTRKLARLLGVSIPTAMGHLTLLWHFALRFAPDGNLSGFEDAEIADGALWEGDPRQFVSALQETHWLDDYTVHDWHEYGGKYHLRRQSNAERMRETREQQRGTPSDAPAPGSYNVSREAPDTRDFAPEQNEPPDLYAPDAHVSRTCDARAAHVEKSVRLEKSRGEKSTGEKSTGEAISVGQGRGGGGGKRARQARPPNPSTPIPEDFAPDDALLAWAAARAPNVNVERETERFVAYWQSTGGTKRDWRAAWRTWLLKAQDDAERHRTPRQLHRWEDFLDEDGAMHPKLVNGKLIWPPGYRPTQADINSGLRYHKQLVL